MGRARRIIGTAVAAVVIVTALGISPAAAAPKPLRASVDQTLSGVPVAGRASDAARGAVRCLGLNRACQLALRPR